MSTQSFKVKSGLTLNPTDLSTLTSPQAGDLACDINDSNKIKRWDGANWVQVGSGGVGGLDFLFTQDFEEVTLADFTYVGLSLDTVSNLHGKVSAKLTHDASVNQYIKDVIAVEPKFRGKNHTIQLTVKSAASAGNVVLKITDETASTDLVVSEQLQLSNNAGGASSSISFDIPETCLSLSYTITALPEAGSPVTIVDDIYCALTASNLFQSGVVQEEDGYYQFNDFILARATTNTQIATIGSGSTVVMNGDHILHSKSSTLGDTFTALKTGIYSFSFTGDIGSSAVSIGLSLNSNQLSTSITSITASNLLALHLDAGSGDVAHLSWSGKLEEGDIVRLHLSTTALSSVVSTYSALSIAYQGSLKQVTINSNQKITIPTSELRFEGASSRGTGTETAIVEFTSLAKLRGDAFEISNSNGTAITMRKAGRLNISCTSAATTVSTFQITKNQEIRTALSTVPSEVLSAGIIAVANSVNSCSAIVDINIGDVIRVSSNAVPSGSPNISLNLSFQEQDISVSVTNTLPQFSESDSCVQVDGAAGFSGNTRLFSNVIQNIGNAVNYVPATGEFITREAGIYNISYSEASNANATNVDIRIYLNGSTTLAFDNQIYNTATPSTKGACASWQGYLNIGDVITCYSNIPANLNGNLTVFTISKVGKPNVTGVDVTPFVNVPQPESQSAYLYTNTTFSSSNPVTGALTRSISSSIFSYNSSTGVYTVLKKGLFNLTYNNSAVGNSITAAVIILDGSAVAYNNTQSTATASNSAAYTEILLPGQQFYFRPSTNAANNHSISVTATATSDQILTQTETFSTDTASLTYAGSGAYTLSTLANAPVGTFITFTYAAGGNARTQTVNTAPSQSTADMNANGIKIFTRGYTSPSTATQPAAIAIQIGKGLKGLTLDLYKGVGKDIAGSLDHSNNTATARIGIAIKEYNESTGVLIIDAGFTYSSSLTVANLVFSDGTLSATEGYVVINASKNPALTGFGLNRIAARATSTAGGAIGTTATLQTFAEETFDTNGAWSGTTYVIPETGYYQVNCGISTAIVTIPTGGGFVMWIYKNGVAETTQRIIGNGAGNLYGCAVNDVLHFKKDDTVQIYASASTATTQNTAAGYNFISISKVSV